MTAAEALAQADEALRCYLASLRLQESREVVERWRQKARRWYVQACRLANEDGETERETVMDANNGMSRQSASHKQARKGV